MDDQMKRVYALILIIVLLAVVISVPVLILEMDRKNRKDEDKDLELEERGEYSEADLSIFRGLSHEQVSERIRKGLGNPELDREYEMFDHSFEKEVHYYYENGAYLSLRTEYHRGKPFDHFLSINPGEPNDDNITHTEIGPTEAVNNAIDFTKNILSFFDCNMEEQFVADVEGQAISGNGWAIDIFQIYNNMTFTTAGIDLKVDRESGDVTQMRIWDWIYMDEVKDPVYDWEHGSGVIVDSMEDANFIVEIGLNANLNPTHTVGWSEVVTEPINETRVIHYGYRAVLGRFCAELGVEYWIDGNFSYNYSTPLDPDNVTVLWVNGTVTMDWKCFFNTQTGRLLYWAKITEKGSTGRKLPDNLE